jgi:hypothetical protein
LGGNPCRNSSFAGGCKDATTLTRLTIQIDQLLRSLEAVAAKVRRHEETIRRLERSRRKPG